VGVVGWVAGHSDYEPILWMGKWRYRQVA
jgi:hypothetical protein